MKIIISLILVLNSYSIFNFNFKSVVPKAMIFYVAEFKYWVVGKERWIYEGEKLMTCQNGTYPEEIGQIYLEEDIYKDNDVYQKYSVVYKCK